MMNQTDRSNDPRFSRGAWLILSSMFVLVVAALALSAYRFSLPTDGWLVVETPPGTPEGARGNIYQKNVMGAPSGLREGDVVTQVEGYPYNSVVLPWQSLPLDWEAGRSVTYTVLRDGQELTVDAPLVHWRFGQWLAGAGTLEVISTGATLLALALIGLFTFLKRPDNKAARALFVLSITLLVSDSFDLPTGNIGELVDPLALVGTSIMITLMYTVLSPPTLLYFTLVFPKPKPALVRHPWLEYLPYAFGAFVIIPMVLTQGLAAWLWTIGTTIGAIVSLVHSAFIFRDSVSRAQLRWGAGGFAVGLLIFLMNFLVTFGVVPEPLTTVVTIISLQGFTIIGLSLAVAILRYRLFDIDLIIRRTLVYSILTALLALTYFGLVTLSQSLTQQMMGEQSPLVVVVSTLVIAALFNPLRRRVQAFVDRRFYRQKYDAQRTLDAFAATLRDEVDLDRMTGELVAVVEKTIQPEQIGLWLQPAATVGRSRSPGRPD
jgi:hypothetical protein